MMRSRRHKPWRIRPSSRARGSNGTTAGTSAASVTGRKRADATGSTGRTGIPRFRRRHAMRRWLAAISIVAFVGVGVGAAPPRKPLAPKEREALLALLAAVDRAQANDVAADTRTGWSHHIFKGGKQTAYVPFRLTLAETDIKA